MIYAGYKNQIQGKRQDGEFLAFSPIQVEGLQLWLRADLGLFQDSIMTTIAENDDDPVGGWEDQSGNENDAIQATDADRPLLKLTIQNGRPILRFDGISDSLRSTFALAQPHTLIVLVNQVTWMINRQIIGGVTANAGVLFRTLATPEVSAFSGSTFGANGNLAVGVFAIAIIEFDDVNSTIQINNTTQTTGNAGANAPGGITIASNQPVNGWSRIDVGEILVYDNILSAVHMTNIKNYLNQRWQVF